MQAGEAHALMCSALKGEAGLVGSGYGGCFQFQTILTLAIIVTYQVNLHPSFNHP